MKDLSKFFASQSSKHLTHEELKFIIGGGDNLSTTSPETSASGKGCDNYFCNSDADCCSTSRRCLAGNAVPGRKTCHRA